VLSDDTCEESTHDLIDEDDKDGINKESGPVKFSIGIDNSRKRFKENALELVINEVEQAEEKVFTCFALNVPEEEEEVDESAEVYKSNEEQECQNDLLSRPNDRVNQNLES
jgi:hypothetical protein